MTEDEETAEAAEECWTLVGAFYGELPAHVHPHGRLWTATVAVCELAAAAALQAGYNPVEAVLKTYQVILRSPLMDSVEMEIMANPGKWPVKDQP